MAGILTGIVAKQVAEWQHFFQIPKDLDRCSTRLGLKTRTLHVVIGVLRYRVDGDPTIRVPVARLCQTLGYRGRTAPRNVRRIMREIGKLGMGETERTGLWTLRDQGTHIEVSIGPLIKKLDEQVAERAVSANRPDDERVAREWSPRIAAGGHIQVPYFLHDHHTFLGFTPETYQIARLVMGYGWGGGAFPSADTLAGHAGIHTHKVYERLHEMERRVLITRTPRYRSVRLAPGEAGPLRNRIPSIISLEPAVGGAAGCQVCAARFLETLTAGEGHKTGPMETFHGSYEDVSRVRCVGRTGELLDALTTCSLLHAIEGDVRLRVEHWEQMMLQVPERLTPLISDRLSYSMGPVGESEPVDCAATKDDGHGCYENPTTPGRGRSRPNDPEHADRAGATEAALRADIVPELEEGMNAMVDGEDRVATLADGPLARLKPWGRETVERYLRHIPGWPVDDEEDARLVDTLLDDFPSHFNRTEIDNFRDWLAEQRGKGSETPTGVALRKRFRKWVADAAHWSAEDAAARQADRDQHGDRNRQARAKLGFDPWSRQLDSIDVYNEVYGN